MFYISFLQSNLLSPLEGAIHSLEAQYNNLIQTKCGVILKLIICLLEQNGDVFMTQTHKGNKPVPLCHSSLPNKQKV